ncbi:MAG: lipid-A-disaccharide synthase [Pseudomonadota bacterium]
MEIKQKKILIVTGEASGDHHGALVVKALKHISPDIQVAGIGGEELEKAGMELLYHSRNLSVVGFSEVLSRASHILTAYRVLKKEILTRRPDLVMFIDYPEFNLLIAAIAKKHHVPVLYYISPQIWAWRQGRAKKIARLVTKMAVIFPFEVPFYQKFGLDVSFVGHPLLDQEINVMPRSAALKTFNFTDDGPIIGLLPGSRPSEIVRLLDPMLGAAEIIKKNFPSVQFILPLAQGISQDFVQRLIHQKKIQITMVTNSFYAALDTCDLVLVASGTATLQTALMGKPMIILYKVALLTYVIGRVLIRIPWIGLANIVAGKKVVPELIQDDITAEKIAGEACALLKDPERMQRIKTELSTIKKTLGEKGASTRVAQMIDEMINPKKYIL